MKIKYQFVNIAPLLEKKASAKVAAEQICEIEGCGIVHRNTAAMWFERLNKGGTSLVEKPLTGLPSGATLEKKSKSS